MNDEIMGGTELNKIFGEGLAAEHEKQDATDDLLAKKIAALMDGNPTCEEASLLSKETFIPCGAPAVAVVKNRDVNPYFMCLPCAYHNVRNRGAKLIAAKKIKSPLPERWAKNKEAVYRDNLTGEVAYAEVDPDRVVQSGDPTTDDLLALSEVLVEQKRIKAEAAETEKKANEEIRSLESKMWTIMQAKDIQRFDHAGKLFYPIVNSFPSVVKEHESEFFAWLKENGEDGIL